MRAVLFRSERRFDAFLSRLREHGVRVDVLDFDQPEWMEYDYAQADFLIYFPQFAFTSNHPQALFRVQDNLDFIHERYPHLGMFPDPKLIRYYSDKYRQLLFLKRSGLPFPETYPLTSAAMVDVAAQRLGYPLVVKNRYGAGGDYVFKVDSRRELDELYRLSSLDLVHGRALKQAWRALTNRAFYWHLLKDRRMAYPFLSPPLLAQRFIEHSSDLKTVVGDGEVVEAHWRHSADTGMWKMNIDGGGIGEWSRVPDEALRVSEELARQLQAKWLNIDLMVSNGRYLISEFSPVWHHYAYKEKESFVYKDDYNIRMPLEKSLDLERIIVESFVRDPRLREVS